MTSDVQSKVFPSLDSNSAYYNEWVFRIKTLLPGKEYFEVIHNERLMVGLTRENLIELQKQYDEKNNKAVDYITSHLSPSALQKVKDVGESAARMWSTLKEAYKNKSVSNQLNLLTRLINLRITKGSNLDQHYATLDGIVSELRLAGANMAEDEPLLTAVLLASMPVSFNAAVTAIAMGSSETPSYEDVRKHLLDHALTITLKNTSEVTPGISISSTIMMTTGI